MFKKLIVINILFGIMLWVFSSVASANVVKSNEYYKAVIANVVQNKVNGTNVDIEKLMSKELEGIGHQYAIEMLTVLQKYLPALLDGALADMRLKADKEYKCKLLKNGGMNDGCVK